jgi:hypothetical protein
MQADYNNGTTNNPLLFSRDAKPGFYKKKLEGAGESVTVRSLLAELLFSPPTCQHCG